MHLSWLGQTAVKIQTKYAEADVIVIIDAYKPGDSANDFPRSLSPDIALFSKGTDSAITLSQNPFILDTLGECDIKEIMINAFAGSNDSLVFSITIEGMHIVHLGRITDYNDALIEKIGSVDILLLPMGGTKNYLSPEKAAELLAALEPRMVIPLAYQCDTDKTAAPLSAFLKEAGLKPSATDKKLIIKKKDLPQEETRLVVLEKNI